MSLPLPSHFFPELTDERLSSVARWLLEELHATDLDLARYTDTRYTRGTTTFGRQWSRLVLEKKSGKHHWFSSTHEGNDIVITVGGVPCRFSNDNAARPTKKAAVTANRYQESFLELGEPGEPRRFCFIVDRGPHEDAEPRVELLGFDVNNQIVCRWASTAVRVLKTISTHIAQPVDISKPIIVPKRRDEDGEAAETGA
ncbi:hypothetical protein [Caldimonas tepidiphila]|uniref:hypothetical protein n=1 Tax=Caldimonas tepidiphila TaxID=2315841 RepID=UPI001300B361|nr:hypothetical protein [Caldimonas tepidiphila]